MNFYELNKIINEQRMPAIINRIKKFGRPIGFDGPVKLSKEIEDELDKIGNIETEEEALAKWQKDYAIPDAKERESQRQKEKEERWSPLLRSKEDEFKELGELEDWLDSQGHIPSDPDAWYMNNIEDVSAVYKTLGSLNDPRQTTAHDRKMIEKLGQHLKRLKSQRALDAILKSR
jgi:hypothetical protein